MISSFEQLCINYTNEELQQFFVHHVFKLEQAEYEKEGVNWKKINFIDNQEIIDLLARGRMSIISMIDEEMIVPQGTDQTLCAKLQQQHGKNKHFIAQSSRQTQKTLTFGVRHFAGPVSYDCLSKIPMHRPELNTSRNFSFHRFFGKESRYLQQRFEACFSEKSQSID